MYYRRFKTLHNTAVSRHSPVGDEVQEGYAVNDCDEAESVARGGERP
ncbi:hypothetical protein [Fusibacter sp. JL216-2]